MLEINSLLSEGHISFYQFNNSDGKVWLIPERNMSIAMELYQPSGIKGRCLKKLFPILHWIPFVSRVIHARKCNVKLNKEILDIVQKAFNEQNIEYSIFGGTPSVHQKITIQFFKGTKILGYGKVTDNPEIESLFVKEQQILDFLRTQGIDNIPECLLIKRLTSGMTFFLQTTEKKPNSISPEEWTPLHDMFLNSLTQCTSVSVPFIESDFYRNIAGLVEFMPVLPLEYKEIISKALDITCREFDGVICKFSAYHGDFTPWNMFVNGDRLFVFDWEYAEKTYPPQLDRYHFFVQQYIHVEHMSAEEIISKIRAFDWYDSCTFRCYLLDIISRFVCREKGCISKDLSEMLKIWANLLLYNENSLLSSL